MGFPVVNIDETLQFYLDTLDCYMGWRLDAWMDFNFLGHQLSAHLSPDELGKPIANDVDGHQVPLRYFSLILEWDQGEALAKQLKKKK